MRNNRAAEKRNEISMADTNVNGGTQQATGKLKSVESLDQTNEMERGLSNRHVQFIAIGGTIGTGGFGYVLGSVIGALVRSTIDPLTSDFGVPAEWTTIVIGLMILVFVVLQRAVMAVGGDKK